MRLRVGPHIILINNMYTVYVYLHINDYYNNNTNNYCPFILQNVRWKYVMAGHIVRPSQNLIISPDVCVCVHVWVSTCLCMGTCVHVYVCIFTCVYMCVHVRACVSIYMCMYVCVCVCLCMCIWIIKELLVWVYVSNIQFIHCMVYIISKFVCTYNMTWSDCATNWFRRQNRNNRQALCNWGNADMQSANDQTILQSVLDGK